MLKLPLKTDLDRNGNWIICDANGVDLESLTGTTRGLTFAELVNRVNRDVEANRESEYRRALTAFSARNNRKGCCYEQFSGRADSDR